MDDQSPKIDPPPADVHQAFVAMKLDPVFSLGQIVFYNTKDLFKKHNFGRDVKRFVNKNDWCVYNNKYHLNARGVITLGFAKKHTDVCTQFVNPNSSFRFKS
jgi:hypothetical protein